MFYILFEIASWITNGTDKNYREVHFRQQSDYK